MTTTIIITMAIEVTAAAVMLASFLDWKEDWNKVVDNNINNYNN